MPNCVLCNKSFHVDDWHQADDWQLKYCSSSCWGKSPLCKAYHADSERIVAALGWELRALLFKWLNDGAQTPLSILEEKLRGGMR